MLTYLLIYLFTHLLTYLFTYLHTHILTYLITYLLTYLITYILTYSLTYILTYLHTHLLSYIFTYLLTPWSRVLLEKLTGLQLVKKFLLFYGNRRFSIALTNARHLSLSWGSSIQSLPPHPTSLKIHLNIILPSKPGFPKSSLSLTFPHQNPVYASHFHMRATCSVHLILLDFFTRKILGEQYRSLSTSLYSFLHSLVFPSLLGPNILLNTLLSNTLPLVP